MSELKIFSDQKAGEILWQSQSHSEIAAKLQEVGVRFEQWETDSAIVPGAPVADVIKAYQKDIDRLMDEEGYQTVDVVSLNSDHPDKAALRQKFLAEHIHSEDEVRFFVAGSGLFSLHVGDKVYEVLCTQGDLISVPDGTPHWFDMGPNPHFVAVRLFNNPEGWVANYTGSAIADQYSRLDN